MDLHFSYYLQPEVPLHVWVPKKKKKKKTKKKTMWSPPAYSISYPNHKLLSAIRHFIGRVPS
jgi:hypothetical protein